MGLHSQNTERHEGGTIQAKEMPRGILIIRLVIASVIFAVSAVVSMPVVVKTILDRVSCRGLRFDPWRCQQR